MRARTIVTRDKNILGSRKRDVVVMLGCGDGGVSDGDVSFER